MPTGLHFFLLQHVPDEKKTIWKFCTPLYILKELYKPEKNVCSLNNRFCVPIQYAEAVLRGGGGGGHDPPVRTLFPLCAPPMKLLAR